MSELISVYQAELNYVSLSIHEV